MFPFAAPIRAKRSCFVSATLWPKGDPGRVASDASEMFDDRRAILADRVDQFARAIESIDLVADPFASGHVRGSALPGCGK
jgi:hypothetical protein